jgi:PIN domain nuclease of toxin-antitoxin system
MKPILLDTVALIWWDSNDPRLGADARVAIRDADTVYVSAASAWEIVIKEAVGKLEMAPRPSQAVAGSGFEMLPVTFEHVEAVANLPRHHKDPFDRLIVAVALVEDLPVVTADKKVRRYPVRTIDARR